MERLIAHDPDPESRLAYLLRLPLGEGMVFRTARRAIDLVLDRSRENRSQIVFTTARGREAVFWQSPRTRKQTCPDVRTPTARAAGIAELHIVVDSHEQSRVDR